MKHVNYNTYPIPTVKPSDGNCATAAVIDDTLVLDLWSDGKYIARYVMDENGKYSAYADGKWRQRKFKCLFGLSLWSWVGDINLSFVRKKDRKAAQEFLDRVIDDMSAGYRYASAEKQIDSIESLYVRKKSERAFDRKCERLRSLVIKTPPVPDDFDEWCLSTVFEDRHYWFYDKSSDCYHCTACGKTHKNHKLKHNADTVCCRSGKEVTVKRRVDHIDSKDYVMLLQRIDDTMSVARHFAITAHYYRGKVSLRHSENVRMFLPRLGLSKFKILYGQYTDRDEFDQAWWETNPANRHTHCCYCYPNGVKEALDGTIYSGIGIADMAAAGWKLEYNSLMCNPDKSRCFEYLFKGGFRRLAAEESDGFGPWGYCGNLNIDGTTATEVLKLDKQRVNRLRQMDGGTNTMLWLREEADDGRQIPTDTLKWFEKNHIHPKQVAFIRDRMSPVQIANYINRMMSQYHDTASHIITQWADYLSMAKRLKMDTSDEVVYRTKDLCRRHDELVERINALNNKQAAAQMARKFQKVNRACKTLKKYEWSNDDFTVIAPKGIADIMREGASLHHCVGTSERYYERIQNGETYIMFLRKTDAVDISYYTLEIEPDGTVRQKRAAYDRQPDIEQVKKFLTEWQKEIAQRLTASDREAAEKSHVARDENMRDLKKNNTWLFNKLTADLMPA